MISELSHRFQRGAVWGLRRAPGDSVPGRVTEQRWRWPTLLALLATIPAFYLELLQSTSSQLRPLATLAYAVAALTVAAALLHTGWRCRRLGQHLAANPLDLALVAGLLLAAGLPASSGSSGALGLRLVVALMTLVRMVWSLQHLITRGGLATMLVMAGLVLGLCGVGYWWLEPTTPTLADGLWLAFVTAGTVGYGDVVPTSPAAKIFSVFVVMLGFGVLSLVTAAVATKWVEAEERTIEREILRDMHRQIDSLHREIQALRQDLAQDRADAAPPAPSSGSPTAGG